MRAPVTTITCLSAVVLCAQGLDVRAGLPTWGVLPTANHYLPDWQGEHLPIAGTHWKWDLDPIAFVFEGEGADTVWHNSADIPPQDGGPISAYERAEQRYSFFHLNGDTLVEDSAWVLAGGTTEVGYPVIPLCWQGQQLGDTLWYFDQAANMERFTCFRATLDLRTPWGELYDLAVFEDRILDHITYRIHRRSSPLARPC